MTAFVVVGRIHYERAAASTIHLDGLDADKRKSEKTATGALAGGFLSQQYNESPP
jgi:hypothetical protein